MKGVKFLKYLVQSEAEIKHFINGSYSVDGEGQQKGGQARGEENRKGIGLFHTIFPSHSQLYDTTCPNTHKYTRVHTHTLPVGTQASTIFLFEG